MARSRSSELERKFAFYLRALAPALPEPAREYRFAKWEIAGPEPGMRERIKAAGVGDWRFDFAWPRESGPAAGGKVKITGGVAVEIEGGVYSGGRHVRPVGFAGDARKYNAAALNGWLLLRYPAEALDDPARVIAEVAAAHALVFGPSRERAA